MADKTATVKMPLYQYESMKDSYNRALDEIKNLETKLQQARSSVIQMGYRRVITKIQNEAEANGMLQYVQNLACSMGIEISRGEDDGLLIITQIHTDKSK